MEKPTKQWDDESDPLSGVTPANRHTRHIRGALAATTGVGLLFGAGTAVAGASSATTPGHHTATHTRDAFRHDHARNAGTVTSVAGSSTAGSCGTAGGTGALVVHTFKGRTRTYEVDTSTTFLEPGVASAGFNNVCVGDVVAVRPLRPSTPDETGSSGDADNTGTASTSGVTASKVFIAPTSTPAPVAPTTAAPATPAPTPSPTAQSQRQPDGSSGSRPVPTSGSPEVRGIVSTKDPSSFDVASYGRSQVVDVTDTTTYVGPGGPTTYGSVAVGDAVRVSGTDVNGAFTATTVSVFPAPSTSAPRPQPGVGGGTTPSPVPQPGPAPSATTPGFPSSPEPTTVTSPSPSGQGGGNPEGQSPQSQSFGHDGAPAGATGGRGR